MRELKILYLVALYLLIVSSYFYITRKERKDFLVCLILILIGLFIALYVREVVYGGDILATTDEANYLSRYYECQHVENCMLSGPGYITLLQLFYTFFPNGLENGLEFFSILVSALSLPMFYLIFRKVFKKQSLAYTSVLALLTTNYFLFPFIEGRPQQIGMLLVLIIAYFTFFFYMKENAVQNRLLFWGLLVLLFYIHILSFFFLLFILLGIFGYFYIKKSLPLLRILELGLVGLLSLILFSLDFGPYSSLSKGLEYTFASSSSLALVFINKFYPLPLILGFIITFSIYLVVIYAIKRDYNRLNKSLEAILQKTGPLILITVAYAIFLAMFVQYTIGYNIYSVVYNNQFFQFFLFQLVNILFIILFLIVCFLLLTGKVSTSEDIPFLAIGSLSLIVLGGVGLIISLILPVGFDNWILRVINYFIIFSFPLVVSYFYKYVNSHKILIVISLLLLIPSLVLTSFDPDLFNAKTSWTEHDLTSMNWLVQESEAGGTYYLITDFSDSYITANYEKMLRYVSYLKIGHKKAITIMIINKVREESKIYSSKGFEIYN